MAPFLDCLTWVDTTVQNQTLLLQPLEHVQLNMFVLCLRVLIRYIKISIWNLSVTHSLVCLGLWGGT